MSKKIILIILGVIILGEGIYYVVEKLQKPTNLFINQVSCLNEGEGAIVKSIPDLKCCSGLEPNLPLVYGNVTGGGVDFGIVGYCSKPGCRYQIVGSCNNVDTRNCQRKLICN
jgi:hypothetical protein